MSRTVDPEAILEAAVSSDPPALELAMEARGRLAIAGQRPRPALDARLAAHLADSGPPPPDLAAWIARLHRSADVADRHAPFGHPGSEEAMVAVVGCRERWRLQVSGLEALGLPASIRRDAVRRLDAELADLHDKLHVFSELAEAEAADAVLGADSAWHLFPAPERLPTPEPMPGEDPAHYISDRDLRAFVDGSADRLQAMMVEVALDHSAALRARLETLALGDPVEPSVVPPGGLPYIVHAQAADGHAPTASDPHPRFLPPGAGSTVWVFPDGTTLHVERVVERWLVSVMPSSGETTVEISADDAMVWVDATDGIHRALARDGAVRIQVDAHRHWLDLTEASVEE